jgi:hypothetical protein
LSQTIQDSTLLKIVAEKASNVRHGGQ